MSSWIVIALWVCVLSFSAIYSFLPSSLQSNPKLRVLAILAALSILSHGIYGVVRSHNSKIFAHITKDGNVTKSNNFKWKIVKDINDGDIIYMLLDLHADVSQVTVVTNSRDQKYSLYKAFGGVAVKFHMPEKDIKDFDVYIENTL